MSNFEKPKNLPIGTGGEFVNERVKETLPALEVKNTVLWRNPAFKDTMPFKIERGKQTNLGIFFTPKPEEYPEEKARRPVIMPEGYKGRSGLLGTVIFQDRDGQLYRDVDIKGIGKFQKPDQESILGAMTGTGNFGVGTTGHIKKTGAQEAEGLMDYEFALRDTNYSEKFLKAGIRTHRVISIAEPEEIIDEEGKKITIAQAKKLKIISKEMHPVFEIRALGTKERIAYLQPNVSLERRKTAYGDAKAMIAQELGKDPDKFSPEEYLTWFTETLGRQTAKIRKLKLFHGYITEHNITLDCRIVDLDSVQTIHEALADKKEISRNLGAIMETEQDFYEHDYEYAISSLEQLARRLYNLKNGPGPSFVFKYFALFSTAYEEELKAKQKPKKERGEVEPSSTKQKKAQEKKAA